MGPFGIVNGNNGLALAVNDNVCKNGMSLISADDDHADKKQQFYLGQHGSIFSAQCPGLVIEATGSNENSPVQLAIAVLGDNKQKWKFTNGMVESVEYPGMVLAINNSAIMLKSSPTATSNQNLNWARLNTRLLDSSSASSGNWKQQWKVSFNDLDYNGPSISEFVQNKNGLTNKCYAMNPAFSASFDNFAKELIVKDPSDEDQCRKVREALGFDKDHPFDVEVQDNFHQHQCDPFFSGVDHVSGDDDMEALTVSDI